MKRLLGRQIREVLRLFARAGNGPPIFERRSRDGVGNSQDEVGVGFADPAVHGVSFLGLYHSDDM